MIMWYIHGLHIAQQGPQNYQQIEFSRLNPSPVSPASYFFGSINLRYFTIRIPVDGSIQTTHGQNCKLRTMLVNAISMGGSCSPVMILAACSRKFTISSPDNARLAPWPPSSIDTSNRNVNDLTSESNVKCGFFTKAICSLSLNISFPPFAFRSGLVTIAIALLESTPRYFTFLVSARDTKRVIGYQVVQPLFV